MQCENCGRQPSLISTRRSLNELKWIASNQRGSSRELGTKEESITGGSNEIEKRESSVRDHNSPGNDSNLVSNPQHKPSASNSCETSVRKFRRGNQCKCEC